MREPSTRSAFSTNYRLGRWATVATGFGALAIAALMAMSPASGAVTGALAVHGGVAAKDYDLYTDGCATGKMRTPTFSVATGIGAADMSLAAKTCKPSNGGKAAESYADAYSEIGKSVSVKLTAAYSTANITFNLKGSAADAASGSIRNCPLHHYYYNSTVTVGNQTGTYNFTEIYGDCYAEAGWQIYGEPEVYDVTTGVYSSAFWELDNTTGTFSDTFDYWENYSNPLTYPNYTYAYSTTNSYGSHNSTGINQAFSSLISGSWAKGDRLIIYATVGISCYTEVYYAVHGKAMASVNLAPPAGHADLVGITLS
jgi:hypothetical protein